MPVLCSGQPRLPLPSILDRFLKTFSLSPQDNHFHSPKHRLLFGQMSKPVQGVSVLSHACSDPRTCKSKKTLVIFPPAQQRGSVLHGLTEANSPYPLHQRQAGERQTGTRVVCSRGQRSHLTSMHGYNDHSCSSARLSDCRTDCRN